MRQWLRARASSNKGGHAIGSMLVGCVALAAVHVQPAWAQSTDSNDDLKAQIAQMRQQMQAQQQVMQKMQQRLDELEAKESSQENATAAAKSAAPIPVQTTQQAPAPLISSATVPSSGQPAAYRPPSAPAGVGEPLPEGYVRLGDTGNLLKLDLVAQLDTMIDNTYMGSKDLFVPSSIPVRGQPFYGSGWNTNLSARQSIFRMDFRRDTDYGTLKVVYKNNFFGSGTGDMPYNLQYFYGELDNERFTLLAGYNISAFTDIDVFPNTLDYEGPNSFNFKYGPQIRFIPILYKWGDNTLTLPLSMEKPNADITPIGDYEPYSRLADFTAGVRWETPDWHIQWSNLFRDLGMQDSATGQTQRTKAFATQLTGSTKLFDRDSAQGWYSNGHGYANFLQDISGLGLDAAFTDNGILRAIRARGWGVGYTHGWTDTLSSSASWGYLRISPSGNMILDRDELPKSTKFASLNLAWQFSQRAMLGIEYLWGQNISLIDMRGQGQRVQTTLRYDLNP
ncbi:DcaP family trimeric outer membrane transporter [Dyella sp. C9]|uniref:DcaP family trimeric outer membrane transporter n=1 Tax=Dyella sp. C9 TaxID=2202154 RepID=UPI000DEEB477|nr:DcaP family trimeric outer membrane transporter [Dyella sp. C9]